MQTPTTTHKQPVGYRHTHGKRTGQMPEGESVSHTHAYARNTRAHTQSLHSLTHTQSLSHPPEGVTTQELQIGTHL